MFTLKSICIDEMEFSESKDTLYIIGNGFDLMHGAESNYYSFRDFLGKKSTLRETLETYLKVKDDLWCDFENSLAYIDGNAMVNTLDMWMEDFGAFEDDALAADYYAAIDAAMMPTHLITTELPIAFRNWIEGISVSTSMPSIRHILSVNGRYLNFNYTEFLETVYNVPSNNICYIHGNRKDKNEGLILGHAVGVDNPYVNIENVDTLKVQTDDGGYIHDPSVALALDQINWYNESTTKATQQILNYNKSFFESLSDINSIIVIGHSLSEVDWMYFEEILRVNKNADWFISWHNSDDLERIKMFINNANLSTDRVRIFKT